MNDGGGLLDRQSVKSSLPMKHTSPNYMVFYIKFFYLL